MSNKRAEVYREHEKRRLEPGKRPAKGLEETAEESAEGLAKAYRDSGARVRTGWERDYGGAIEAAIKAPPDRDGSRSTLPISGSVTKRACESSQESRRNFHASGVMPTHP